MRTVGLFGGPLLYREALGTRLKGAGIQVVDGVEVPVDVSIVFCEFESDFETLAAHVAANPTVAVLAAFDVHRYMCA